MKKIVLYIMLVLLCDKGLAQDSIKKTFIRAYDVSVFVNAIEFEKKDIGGNDYHKMLPENSLLKNYKANGGRNSNSDMTDIGISSSFTFWNKQKQRYNDRIQLRVGLFYNTQSFDLDENGTYRSACDTLISNSSSTVYYIDTVKQYSYSLHRQGNAVGFYIQNTFHTKQTKFLSFYAGYGVRYSYNIHHQLYADLHYSETFEDQNSKTYYSTYESSNNYSVSETTVIQASNALSVYIPVGVNLRVVRPVRKTISRLALNPEIAVGYRIQEFANYGSYNTFFFYVKFGATYYFHKAYL